MLHAFVHCDQLVTAHGDSRNDKNHEFPRKTNEQLQNLQVARKLPRAGQMRVQTAVTARLAALLLQLQAGDAALGKGAGHPAECGVKLTCVEGARFSGPGFLLSLESVALDAMGISGLLRPSLTLSKATSLGPIGKNVADTD